MTTKINSINFGVRSNYATYEDTDSSVDYFNGLSLNQKDTIEYLKKDGGKYIQVTTSESYDLSIKDKYLNKIARVAKAAGYINNVTAKERYQEMDNIRIEWTEISGQFVKGGGN